MSKPLISVIVPVYKAEPYLEKCVDSIRNQTYQNLEIILVDDGSPDRCGEMCDELAGEDSRIRVIHKENGGQSSARNAGLDIMTGEFVGFVDSDDWIEPDMYQKLYDLTVKHNAQIAACGIRQEYANGSFAYFNHLYPADDRLRTYTRMEALEESLDNTRLTYSPCDKLYAKSIFSSIRMTVGKIYEDMEMIPKCLELCDCVVYDPTPLYHYNLTNESTIRGEFRPARFAEADVALEKANDYKLRYPALYHKAMSCYVAICLNIVYLSHGVPACAERRAQMIASLGKPLPQPVIAQLGRNDRLKLAVLRRSPALYMLMLRLLYAVKH